MRTLPLFLLLACDPKGVNLDDDTGTPTPPTPAISVSGGALDPLLAAELSLDVTAANGSTVALTISDASGVVVRTLADGSGMVDVAVWNGRDDQGTLLPVGTYTVSAELLDTEAAVLASGTATVYIVRVGVLSGTLGGERIPLVWHQGAGGGRYWVEDADDLTFELAAIDDGVTATALPALWDDLDVAPDDGDEAAVMPACYPFDASPTLTLAVAGEFGDAPVSLTVSGWGDPTKVGSGDTPVFARDSALAVGPTVVEETITLSWSVDGVVLGTQSLPLRFYATLGEPGFEDEGNQYHPWVAAIDPALRAISGVEGTESAMLTALTAWIYTDLGLAYDTDYGASYYTSYSGRGYDNAEFAFSDFLDRRNGTTVNCTDCASILQAYADMLGSDLSYTIILSNFELNFIKAIGGDDYTHCPFGPGGCGFSYHAVTTPDDTETIWDATLILDGDDDPGAAPHTEMPVAAVSGEEYLERLVMSGRTTYNYTQKETLR